MADVYLSKGVKKFIQKLESSNAEPLYKLTPDTARDFLLDLQSQTSIEINAQIYDERIQTSYGAIRVKTVRPNGIDEELPAIIYLHGGGWILGDFETHSTLVKKLSYYTRSAIIFPEFSRSPEATYPQAIDQIYEITNHICENSVAFNIDRNRLAFAGDSAGANMATVVSMMIKNRNPNNINLRYLALFYPVTDAEMNTKTYNDFKDGPWLTKKAMEWFWNAYSPEKQIRESIYISPLKADINELTGLPKTLIITAENDVLREEGELFARKLDEAGVDVFSIRVNGTIHDFIMLNALQNTYETNSTIKIAGKLLKDALYFDYRK